MTEESKMKVETTKYIQMSVQYKQYRYIFLRNIDQKMNLNWNLTS